MIIKITIGSWRFTWSMAPITKIVGANSILPDGNHIIMWDFDASNFWTVHDTLLEVQQVYKLPNIYIMETKTGKNFQAYCFKKVSWRRLVEILAYTKGLDWNFFKYGIYRGVMTLRVSPKCGRKITLAYVLKSKEPEDVFLHDLRSWVEYQTLRDNYSSKLYEVKLFAKEG